MDNAGKFLLHYYLAEHSHSMDAYVRNRCEAEVLAIVREIATQLDLDIRIESEAYQEGGLKEIFRLIGQNPAWVAVFLNILTLIFSRYPVIAELDELNKESTRLTIQEKKLAIEEKRILLEKLKLEMKERQGSAPPEAKVAPAATAISDSPKVSIHRSNFYKQLIAYPRVTSIGLGAMDQAGAMLQNEKIVSSNLFANFIVISNDLPTEVIGDARIEIISPVLREGSYKWKGIYNDSPISFSMSDLDFKASVLSEVVSFQHGSAIECVLKVRRRLDESGNEVIAGYDVATVLRKVDGQSSIETAQGRRYAYETAGNASQGNLLFVYDEAG